MRKSAVKVITVSPTGQISLGKAWAGRQVAVQQIDEHKIEVTESVVIPKSQAVFYTPEAMKRLDEFDEWEAQNPELKNTDLDELDKDIKRRRKELATRVRPGKR